MKLKTSLKPMARIENNLAELVNKHKSMPQVKIYQRSHKASKILLHLQYRLHEIGAYLNFLLPYSEKAVFLYIFHENGI